MSDHHKLRVSDKKDIFAKFIEDNNEMGEDLNMIITHEKKFYGIKKI